jgi:hypothetical protein
MRHTINTRWLAIQSETVATFLVVFGGRMNILFIMKVRFLMLVLWSYRLLPHNDHKRDWIVLQI